MNQIQNLLYDSLINTQHVDSAALIKIREGIAITSPPRFQVSSTAESYFRCIFETLLGDVRKMMQLKLLPPQIRAIIGAFKNTPAIRKEGFHFHDKNYRCVRADKDSIYAKCDNEGVVMVKTKSNILLATYRDGMYPSVCVEATEKLGCYFREKEL